MSNTKDDNAGLAAAPGSAEIPFTVLATATQEQVRKASHEAAYEHFGREGEGSIHLTGLRLTGEDGINKTFVVIAELRQPPNSRI